MGTIGQYYTGTNRSGVILEKLNNGIFLVLSFKCCVTVLFRHCIIVLFRLFMAVMSTLYGGITWALVGFFFICQSDVFEWGTEGFRKEFVRM